MPLLPPIPLASVVNIETYGASGSASASVNKAALLAAADAAMAAGLPLFIPGFYSLGADPGIVLPPGLTMVGVSSSGSGFGVSSSQSITSPAITIGDGTINYTTRVENLLIYGDTPAYIAWSTSLTPFSATNLNAALLINAGQHAIVNNISVLNMPMAFDFTGNPYGITCFNLQAGSGTNMLGMRLRSEANGWSGNDISFWNCWISGYLCAVVAEGNSGGYHFHGGQFYSGSSDGSTNTPADGLGAFVYNIDLTSNTNNIPTQQVTMWGVSFEGTDNVWQIRGWGSGGAINLHGTYFNSTAGLCIGIHKQGDTAASSSMSGLSFSMYGCRFVGTYTGAQMFDTTTDDGSNFFVEHGTSGGYAVSGGSPGYDARWTPGVWQSQMKQAHAASKEGILVPGGIILNASGDYLQRSLDWGSTYLALTQPLNIAQAWYDSSDTSTITKSGSNVISFADKSGNGNTLTQGTPADGPTETTVNSLNALALTSSQSLYVYTSTGLPSGNAVWTWFLVTAWGSGALTNYSSAVGFGQTTGNGVGIYCQSGYGIALGTSINAKWANSPAVDTSLHVYQITYNGGNVEDGNNVQITVDGSFITDTNIYGTNGPPDITGVGLAIGISSWSGTFCEETVYSAALDPTGAQGQLMQGYYAWKWGAEANLPGGHPWKSAAPTNVDVLSATQTY